MTDHTASAAPRTISTQRPGRSITVGLRGVLVAVVAAVALLAMTASSAWADLQWYEGQPATSTFTCVGQIVQGADIVAGYQADPSSLPKAGDLFYGLVGFGAAIPTCDGGTQYGEVDLVLPPGVTLAVDASHPITCTYTDLNAPTVPDPTCPTNTDDHGIYGPALSPNGPGTAWRLPAGRWFEIRFPLRSDRQLQGEAGGYCPQTIDQLLATSSPNDCLEVALGLADGADNPWLLAHEGLVIDPAATPAPTPQPPTPTPQPSAPTPKPPRPCARPTASASCAPVPTPKPPRVVTRITFAHAHLAALANRPLALSLRCATRCRGNVTIAISAATAKRLRLAAHPLTLAHGHFAAGAGTIATVHLDLPHRLAMSLRRLRSLPVTVTAVPSSGANTVAHRTLQR